MLAASILHWLGPINCSNYLCQYSQKWKVPNQCKILAVSISHWLGYCVIVKITNARIVRNEKCPIKVKCLQQVFYIHWVLSPNCSNFLYLIVRNEKCTINVKIFGKSWEISKLPKQCENIWKFLWQFLNCEINVHKYTYCAIFETAQLMSKYMEQFLGNFKTA